MISHLLQPLLSFSLSLCFSLYVYSHDKQRKNDEVSFHKARVLVADMRSLRHMTELLCQRERCKQQLIQNSITVFNARLEDEAHGLGREARIRIARDNGYSFLQPDNRTLMSSDSMISSSSSHGKQPRFSAVAARTPVV